MSLHHASAHVQASCPDVTFPLVFRNPGMHNAQCSAASVVPPLDVSPFAVIPLHCVKRETRQRSRGIIRPTLPCSSVRQGICRSALHQVFSVQVLVRLNAPHPASAVTCHVLIAAFSDFASRIIKTIVVELIDGADIFEALRASSCCVGC
jgi:hypothetical protein